MLVIPNECSKALMILMKEICLLFKIMSWASWEVVSFLVNHGFSLSSSLFP